MKSMLNVARLALAASALGALAVLAPASASAEACTKHAGSKHYVVCVGGEKLGTSSEAKTATFESHLTVETEGDMYLYNEPKPQIKCPSVTTRRGSFHSGGSASAYAGGFEIVWSKCKVYNESGQVSQCTVPNPMEWSRGYQIAFGPQTENATISPESGEIFAEFFISGTGCGELIEQTDFALKGKPACTLKEPEVEKVAKELVCTKEKAVLTFDGTHPARLAVDETVELTATNAGKKFSVIEG